MTNKVSDCCGAECQEEIEGILLNTGLTMGRKLMAITDVIANLKSSRNTWGVDMRLTETEADFQSWVIDYAHLKKWRVAHFRGAWSKDGKRFMTPVQADGGGWPDLCLVREGDIIFAELKSERGKTSAEQDAWLIALARNPLVQCYIWSPGERESIMKILESPQAGQAEKQGLERVK